MRRVLLFALCALLLSPAVAAAKGKKVDRSPGEITAYWTVERMKNAKPVERAKPGGGKKPPSSGGFTSREAGSYDSAAGKLFFTDDGVDYVCSGTVLANDVVWTAGHCVHDGRGGTYHDKWMFVPAYRGGAEPYGRVAATSAFTADAWASSTQYGVDLGAIKVTGLRSDVRRRTLNTSGTNSGFFTSHGYPAGSPFTGQLQWTCAASVARLDTSATPATMGLPCDMTGGSSGGGWYGADGQVYSVNSYGYSTVRNTMFGPAQGAAARALYRQAGGF